MTYGTINSYSAITKLAFYTCKCKRIFNALSRPLFFMHFHSQKNARLRFNFVCIFQEFKRSQTANLKGFFLKCNHVICGVQAEEGAEDVLAAAALDSSLPFYWRAMVTGESEKLFCGCQFIGSCLCHRTQLKEERKNNLNYSSISVVIFPITSPILDFSKQPLWEVY